MRHFFDQPQHAQARKLARQPRGRKRHLRGHQVGTAPAVNVELTMLQCLLPIRQSAADSSNVAFAKHAWSQMRVRHVNQPMVMEVLRMGRMYSQPEPDIRFAGLKCRMEHFVSGIDVAVVVAVEYPEPGLAVVPVIDITKG